LKTSGLVLDAISQVGGAIPGAVIHDHSRMKNNGTFVGGLTWAQLPSGLWVAGFNMGDYIVVPHHVSLNFVKNLSIETWCKFNSFPAPGDLRYVLDKGNLGASTGWMCLIDGVNPYYSFLIGNGVAAPSVTSAVLVINTWYHFVATFEGRYSRMYQNGVLTDTTDFGVYITIANIASNLLIGCETAMGGEFLRGYLGMLKVYTYEFTPAQVRARFTATRRLFNV